MSTAERGRGSGAPGGRALPKRPVTPGGQCQVAPQQPVKVVAFVGVSPTRRVGRFATEQPGACPPARRGGE